MERFGRTCGRIRSWKHGQGLTASYFTLIFSEINHFLFFYVWQEISLLLLLNSRLSGKDSISSEITKSIVILLLPLTMRPSLIHCLRLLISYKERYECLLTYNFDMQTHLCTWHTNKKYLQLHRTQQHIRYISVACSQFCVSWPDFTIAAMT